MQRCIVDICVRCTPVLLLAFVLSSPLQAAGVRSLSQELRPAPGRHGFTVMPADITGIRFTNMLSEWASASNRVLNNGSGVAAGDYDGDGKVDLFFSGLESECRLYRNLGHWKFEDATEQTGLKFAKDFYRGAVFADVNGDGWLDLLVGSLSQGVRCFWNDGRGHFVDATDQSGIVNPYGNSSFALADIDGNGTLDLYIANYRRDDVRDWPRIPVMFVNRQPTIPPSLQNRLSFQNKQIIEVGEADQLFLNDGKGRFKEASWTDGRFLDEEGRPLKSPPMDWGLSVAFRDLNNDGAPDLYVCNDYWTPDRIWINTGEGRFRALPRLALRRTSASSMGVDFADINRDGHLDIFVVDMLSRFPGTRKRQALGNNPVAPTLGDIESRTQVGQNTLLLNRGDDTYAEIACLAGLHASEWSWTPLFVDVDLDGYDDLIITTGHIRDIQDLDANEKVQSLQNDWRRSAKGVDPKAEFTEAKIQHNRLYPPLSTPIVAFRNKGNLRFEDNGSLWGFIDRGVHHGAALADLDNDGDLDLVVNVLGKAAAVYRNNAPTPRVSVKLHGQPPNTDAIGAQVELRNAQVPHQMHEVAAGGHYLSCSDTRVVFAPGSAQGALALSIRWPDGQRTELNGITANTHYDIWQPAAATFHVRNSKQEVPQASWFQDVSRLINHRHEQAASSRDIEQQPLLTRRLNQAGPCAVWYDCDRDGWDDLILSSGNTESPVVFLNQLGQSFRKSSLAISGQSQKSSVATLLGFHEAKQSHLIATHPPDENPGQGAARLSIFDWLAPGTESHFDLGNISPGALAMADIDGDGDLDLFVGGQYIPGQYPSPASSRIYRREKGQWLPDSESSALLSNVGLVQGAQWVDLTNDGFPDLVLACEWGSLRLFENHSGHLLETTRDWGLHGITGLWMGLCAGDFDGDGRLDLAVGNWGMNSTLKATPDQPLALLYGFLSDKGQLDLIETETDPVSRKLVPRLQRNSLLPSLPHLYERFPTHASYSRAAVADLWLSPTQAVSKLTAHTLAASVFLNRGGHFDRQDLPVEAQFAPSIGVAVADFDGDGAEDIFLTQNFFAMRWEDQRLDAGRGLLLKGDNRGRFKAVEGQESGIKIYGDQRAAALADFDHDRRVDIVVTQNAASTFLYRNQKARPSLCVRLHGPPNNPAAAGAVLRLRYPTGHGPARAIHLGGGYWSQDSTTVILGRREPPSGLEILWPGGARSYRPLNATEEEIEVSQATP